MNITKKLITPSIAKGLLESNTKNRGINELVVSRYANDILKGNWKEDTGEAIKISKMNIILDGQHRLCAIVKANKPIYLHVIEDLDDSVFDVLDTGKPRSAVDVFKIQGIKQDKTIPSIIVRYKSLKKGRMKTDTRKEHFTNSELLDIYNEQQSYWQNVAKKSLIWYKSFAKILAPSLLGGFYSFFYDISTSHADEFMNQLATGNDIKSSSIKLLRAKLMNDKLSSKKMPIELRGAIIIKAWNFYRKNENPKLLKWDSSTEPFPKAI
jgi:hypothetical protein